MTLAEFLLARISEQEAPAREQAQTLLELDWRTCPACGEQGVIGSLDGGERVSSVVHPDADTCYLTSEQSGVLGPVDHDGGPLVFVPSRQHVNRVLTECEAKKRIVALHHHPGNYCPQCVNIDDGEVVFHIGGCPTLHLLALPFADHPDYDESWRP